MGRLITPDQMRLHTAVVAVSGGADSVALACSLVRWCRWAPAETPRIHLAHVNHGLRPGESDRDEQLVVELGRSLQVPCHVRRWDRGGESLYPENSFETAARTARYQILTELASELGARYLMTAHTWDDHIETILFRVLRGTGLSGLRGIPATRPLTPELSLLRPLRDVRRADLIQLLREWEQPYCHDSTNDNLQPTRNRIRHQVIPLLQQQFDWDVSTSLSRLAQLADQYQSFIEKQATELESFATIDAKCGRVKLARPNICRFDSLLVQVYLQSIWPRMNWPLREMGLDQWHELVARIFSRELCGQSFALPGNIRYQLSAESVEFWRAG